MTARAKRVALGVALSLVALALAVSPASGQPAEPTSAPLTETSVLEDEAFGWGDAAIGALAGAGLVCVVLGLAVVVRTERPRRRRSG